MVAGALAVMAVRAVQMAGAQVAVMAVQEHFMEAAAVPVVVLGMGPVVCTITQEEAAAAAQSVLSGPVLLDHFLQLKQEICNGTLYSYY